MLKEEDREKIQERLKGMKDSVNLIFFTQMLESACQYCTETEQLLKEVAQLSDKLKLEILNFVTDKDRAKVLGVDKIPATVIMGKEDVGICFYGIPTGYEFATFLETILKVSHGDSELSDDIKKRIQYIKNSVHIQVFVTPTCPYCTTAALTAYRFALESEKVKADVVEVTEFPPLVQKYGVMGVPKVVINENPEFEGALPEDQFLEHVLSADEALSSER